MILSLSHIVRIGRIGNNVVYFVGIGWPGIVGDIGYCAA